MSRSRAGRRAVCRIEVPMAVNRDGLAGPFLDGNFFSVPLSRSSTLFPLPSTPPGTPSIHLPISHCKLIRRRHAYRHKMYTDDTSIHIRGQEFFSNIIQHQIPHPADTQQPVYLFQDFSSVFYPAMEKAWQNGKSRWKRVAQKSLNRTMWPLNFKWAFSFFKAPPAIGLIR